MTIPSSGFGFTAAGGRALPRSTSGTLDCDCGCLAAANADCRHSAFETGRSQAMDQCHQYPGA